MRCFILCAVLAVSGAGEGAGTVAAPGPDRVGRLAVFLAGFELLAEQADMSDSLRYVELVQLERLSGVSLATALNMIERYRDRPEAWQRVLERVEQRLDQM